MPTSVTCCSTRPCSVSAFSAASAAAVAGASERDVRALLDGLVTKQFLAVSTDPLSPERGQYQFSHRQIQRVALATMSKPARKARHLAAAEWLAEGEPDPDVAGLYAGHLLAAADTDPAARRCSVHPPAGAYDHRRGGPARGERRRATRGRGSVRTGRRDRAGREAKSRTPRRRLPDGPSTTATEPWPRATMRRREHCTRRPAARVRRSCLRARELYAYRWTRPAAELIEPLRGVYDALRGTDDAAFAAAAATLAGVLYSDGDAHAAEVIAGEAADAAEIAGAPVELGVALNWRASAFVELGPPGGGARAVPSGASGTRAPCAGRGAVHAREPRHRAVGARAVRGGRRRRANGDRSRRAVRQQREPGGSNASSRRTLFCLGDWDEALETIGRVELEATPANAGMAIGPPVLVALARGEYDAVRSTDRRFRPAPRSVRRRVRERLPKRFHGGPRARRRRSGPSASGDRRRRSR